MLFETLSVVVYFHAVFTSIVIWKVLTCTVSNALDQFPYLHTLHVTWKPAYLWKTFQNAMHASFLYDMVRMWAKVSLDMLEGVDGFLDLVKALKNKKKNNFDICIS